MQLLSEFRLRTLNTPFGFYDRTLIDMHLQSLYQHRFGRKNRTSNALKAMVFFIPSSFSFPLHW